MKALPGLVYRLMALIRLPRFLLARSRPGVRIVMYHGVCSGAKADAPFGGRGKHVPAAIFRQEMAWVRRHMQPLSVDELVEALAGRTAFPRCGVVITLDDGYRNNFEVALPVLQEYRIPAAVYITTSLVEGEPLWVDRLDAALEALAANRVEVPVAGGGVESLAYDAPAAREHTARELRRRGKRLAGGERDDLVSAVVAQAGRDLAAEAPESRPLDTQALSPDMVARLPEVGVTVGAHGVRHEVLARCPPDLLRREVEGSRSRLEKWCGGAVRHFAYPNGGPEDHDARCESVLKEAGFRSALLTVRGVVRWGHSPFHLPRFPADGGEGVPELAADLSGTRPALLALKRRMTGSLS